MRALLAGGHQPVHRLKRARIPLAADEGASDAEIAGRVVCGMSTVTRTKRRLAEGKLELALSEARPARYVSQAHRQGGGPANRHDPLEATGRVCPLDPRIAVQ